MSNLDNGLGRRMNPTRGALAACLVLSVLAVVSAQEDDAFLLEDFEVGPLLWTGPGVVDETVAKSGQRSLRWDAGPGGSFVRLTTIPGDWSDVNRFGFWCHSLEATGARIMVRLPSENPNSEGIDYFHSFFEVDWTGWRRVVFDLPRELLPNREPEGWGAIDLIELRCEGWGGLQPAPGTILHFDDFALWNEPAADRLVLSDFERDTGAWSNLVRDDQSPKDEGHSALWQDTVAKTTVRNAKTIPADWTGFTHLRFWLHSEKANGAAITLYVASENEQTPEPDYYSAKVTLDWEGWRELILPLAELKMSRKPRGWNQIDSVSFHASGWGVTPRPDTVLRFDDLCLWREPLRLTSLGYAPIDRADRRSLRWRLRVENCSAEPTEPEFAVEPRNLPGVTAQVEQEPPRALAPDTSAEIAVLLTLDDTFHLPVPSAEPSLVAAAATAKAGDRQRTATAELPGGALFFATLKPGPHPRLFFTKDDLTALRAKLEHPRLTETWTTLQQWTGDLRKYRTTVRTIKGGWTRRSQAATGMLFNAYAYLMKGEPERRAAAVDGLNALLQCDTWLEDASVLSGRPMDIRSAAIARQVATTYDWLYDELPEDTRAKVREKLKQFCFDAGARAWQRRQWYMTTYQYNQACLCYSALGIAALAVIDELPEAAEAGALAVQGAGRILESIGRDGGWQEGPSYLEFGMPEIMQFLHAMRAESAKTDWFRHARLQAAGEFELYELLPYNRQLNFSDGYPFTCSPSLLLKLAAELRQPEYQWAGDVDQQMPNLWDVFQLLWYDTSLAPQGPANRPTAKHFRGIDWAVLRSGWSGPYAALGLRSGRRGPHAQLESNSVIVRLAGVSFISDPGQPRTRGSSFYPKDYFTEKGWKYYVRSTRGQSTILIDGKNQLPGEEGGRIAKLESHDDHDYLCADATVVYEGAHKVIRHVIFVKPDWYVIADEVATREPATIDCLWHFDTYLDQPVWKGDRFVCTQKERRPKGKFGHHQYGPPEERQRLVLVPLLPQRVAEPTITKDETYLWATAVRGAEPSANRLFVTALAAGDPLKTGDDEAKALGVGLAGRAEGADYLVTLTRGEKSQQVRLVGLLRQTDTPGGTALTGVEVTRNP